MITGTVKWYNENKRFGFIVPDDGGDDVFVHVSSLEKAGLHNLAEGQRVHFSLGENKGKSCAIDLKIA